MMDTEPTLQPGRPSGLRGRLPLYAALVVFGSSGISTLGLLILQLLQAGTLAAFITRVDFVGLYLGARLVTTGQAAHLYDLTLQHQWQQQVMTPYAPLVHSLYYTYPGWDAVLLAPLGLLSYPAAFAVWTGLNLLLAGVTLTRLIPATVPPGRPRAIAWLVALGFVPLWYTLWQGQTAIPVWLGLTGAFLSWRAGREGQAGAWLALGLLKPQIILVPVLALLVARRWRALASLTGGGLILLAASLLALGNWIPSYLALLARYVQVGASLGDDPSLMQNWRGLLFRLLGTDSGLLAGSLVAVLTILTVALAVAICRPPRSSQAPAAGGDPDWEARFAVAILLGLLADSHLYLHDTLIALVPGFMLWQASAGGGRRARLLRALLLLGPVVARIAVSWEPPFVELGAVYLVLVLLATAWAWPALGPAYAARPSTGAVPVTPTREESRRHVRYDR